jgi:mitogen-activated protein kinase 1/3
MSKLRHEHVVRLYDLAINNHPNSFTELYIVMELCDSDLKKLCRTDATLTPLMINTLLYNLLVGLHYLHSAGIFHRDLKPANCLVNQDCSVKICDFGLCRAIGEDVSERSESPAAPSAKTKRHLTGHVVTRWYRAPELILLQENYNEAIDIWSVGCIYAELLNMLEGVPLRERQPLFPGNSCFPLSPDHKHKTDYKYHTKGKHDQLNMIFNLLGTPSEADLDQLEREDARRYVRCFTPREGTGLRQRFPHIEEASMDILERMLRFNPRDRVRVGETLEHSLFQDNIRVPEKEITAKLPITLDLEKEPDLDEELLRSYLCKEVQRFRPEVVETWRNGGA